LKTLVKIISGTDLGDVPGGAGAQPFVRVLKISENFSFKISGFTHEF